MGLQFYTKSLLSILAILFLLYFAAKQSTEVFREVVHTDAKANEARRGNDNDGDKRAVGIRTDVNTEVQTSQVESLTTGSTETTSTTATTNSISESFKAINNQLVDKYDEEMLAQLEIFVSTQSNITTTSSQATTTHSNTMYQESPEIHHVAFIKIHKTGSSTAQNIFLRFGVSRNLTFVLAHDDLSLSETRYPNVISYSNSLSERNIVSPPDGRGYDIMCCHVVYNKENFTRIMPADTKYIALIRHPITRLESAMRYFNMFPNVNLSDFAASPLTYDKGKHSMANNRMAFELGFPLSLFPNSYTQVNELDRKIEASAYMDELMSDYSLIMINERMDESVVMLKRVLGWQLKDIIYQKQLVAKHETRRFSETDANDLRNYLYLDFALYERAVQEFTKQVANAGDDFVREVEYFKMVNEKVTFFCGNASMTSLSFDRSLWGDPFEVTRFDCELYKKPEIKFIQHIRLRMYGTLNN
ncbi:G3ST3-like protein [Mya arenaria]|uniref:G3ST3-like protein n=1 Tax=Mya arenaria TaxID=6604 RepID=A0ABY7ETC6_MYAAR|nr:galactose-3-O-sulfotransferase 3-like [Mya arenaria]WAR13222.1 G3ST3-like protein [Mya arenaria]